MEPTPTKYLVIDCETGGLDPEKNTLLTFNATVVDIATLQVVDSLDVALKPEHTDYVVHPRALSVNKIDLVEHHKTAISYGEASLKLYGFLEKHKGGPNGPRLIPCGHNIAKVDVRFLSKLVGSWTWEEFCSHRNYDTACVANFLVMKGWLSPDESISLGNLCKIYGVSSEGHHTAKADVDMVIGLLKAWKDMKF